MGLFGSDSPSKKEETAPLVTPEKEGLRQRRKSPFTKADEEKKDKIDQLVLAASDKVSPQVAEWRDMPRLKLLNLLYDVTPMKYLTMVVTEAGVVPPTSVPVIIREDAARMQQAAREWK